jgi:hypothetical protein
LDFTAAQSIEANLRELEEHLDSLWLSAQKKKVYLRFAYAVAAYFQQNTPRKCVITVIIRGVSSRA